MAYVYIWGPGWWHQFSCIVLSGPPADGTILHVVFYPDSRLTAHSYKKFIGIPGWRQSKVKASPYVLQDIRQVAALNFVIFWWWVAYVHMCVCCCTCVAYVRAYVREKVMFEVYGGESMSEQYRFFFVLAIY